MKRFLLLSILITFGMSSLFGVNASWDYTVTTSASSPISMTGATVLSMTGSGSQYDDYGASLQWPFSFQIYDDVYSTSNGISFTTNGYFRFDYTLALNARSAVIPTNSGSYGQFLSYGGNTDGRVPSGSNLSYKVTGTAPNRVLTFAFSYNTWYNQSSADQHADIQVSFYEANDNIVVDYSNVGGTGHPATYLGMNAGDGFFGTNYGGFPTTATRITYTPGSAIGPPQSFTNTVASSCEIDLAWTKNTSGSDVIIAENTTNSFGTPSNGTSYTVGGSLGGATIKYIGAATSYQHTALSSNSPHFYKIWSKSSSNIYSQTGLTTSNTTNSVTSPTFTSATGVSSSEIDLLWALNGYSDNVIVTYNTVNSFASPQDGTSYTVGNQIGGQQTVLYKGNSTTFSHTGLSINTTYYYKIWSYGCQNDYSSGVSKSGTTQSAANPSSFTSSSITSCQINLAWTKNASSDDVMVVFNTSNSFGTPTPGVAYSPGNSLPGGGGTVLYNGSATSYNHSSRVDNTTYYYKAFSVTSSNSYSTGLTYNATTTTIADAQSFSATAASATQINLSWQKNSAGDNVIITNNTTGSFTAPTDGQSYNTGNSIGSDLIIYKGSATAYAHSGLASNSTHYYKVWSYDCGLNYSAPGKTANATTSSIGDPTLTATAASSCEISLSWTKNSSSNDVMILANTSNTFGTPTNSTAYTVGYTFAGGGKVIYNGSGTSYSHTALLDNTHYYYKAFSVTSANQYSSGSTGDATTLTIADPNTFAATASSSTQIDLTWTKNTAGDNVIITTNTSNSFTNPTNQQSYSVGNTIGGATVIYIGSATNYSHTGLTVNSTHYYKAWSYDCGYNYSSPGKTDNATTTNIAAPGTLSATATKSCEIALAWSKNSSSDDVMILANTSNTFGTPTNSIAYTVGYTIVGGGKVIYNGSGTSYNHTALLDNTHYYFKAFSVTSSNQYSTGVTADATTSTIANPASYTITPNGSTQIDHIWSKNTANDNVIILYNTTGSFTAPTDGVSYSVGNYIGSASVIYNGSGSSYSHTGLAFNTTYYYKIYSYDCGVNYSGGTAKNASTGSVSNTQAFSATGVSSCTDSLAWTKNTSGDDVMILYNTTNSFATPTNTQSYSQGYVFPFGHGIVAYVGSATKYIHSPLYDNTKYYYKIFSKNSSNYYSSGTLDSATTPLISDPATFTATSAGTSQINLSWTWTGASDEVIITYNTVNNFQAPTDGLTYSVGNQIAPGKGIVLYKGSLTSFSHSSLNLNSTYYYKIWAYDCAPNYSTPGKAANATTGTVADPQSFTATGVSSSQINLTWSKNTSNDDVMIAYNTINTFATPSNGISYPVGNQIASGQGTVIYNGPLSAFNHTGLNMNTVYYYKAWSKNSGSNYSPGITANDTTLGVDDPASLTATTFSSSQINLTWSKNTAGDSVMILYNTVNSFASPTNGFSYVIGNQIASGQGTVLYKGPATSFSHTGLTASTKYYYKAVSYNAADYYSTPGLLDSATTDFPGVSTFPYLEDFETQTPNQGNLYSCVTYYPLTSGWNNVQTVDDIDWVVRTGTTPSGSWGTTGPAGDHTTGNGKYIYTEANSCYNKAAWLVSPLFNFTSLSTPHLEFYYFMLGSGTGSINVQISTNGGTTWSTTNLFNKSGQQQTSQSSSWGHADINLTAYAGMANIMLRIKGTTGFNYASDMAIDDIRVFQPQNMAVNSIVTEQDTFNVVLGAANQEVIRVKITTLGAYSPLTLTQLDFNTLGTQSVSDIHNAKVFYTANNPTFTTTQQFGNTNATPVIAYAISGSQVLAEGVNYFWLTYDIQSTATIGHVVDSRCLQATIASITHTPSVTNPSGDKTIVGQVIVGTGTANTYSGPVYPAYYYGAHESIYLSSEMGTGVAKEINKIAWYKASGNNITDNIDNVKIYMKNASGSSLSSGTYSTTGYTMVYNGQMPNYLVTGWIDVNLDNTFLWDGTSNLHVLVVQQKPSSAWSQYPYWRYTTTSPNKARGQYNYNSAPTSLNSTNRRPNARFEYVLPLSMSYASSTTIQPNTANVAKGTNNVEVIGVKVETNNTANPLSLSKLMMDITGTTSASDISNAKIYYTGTSSSFATTTQFGSTVVSPTGAFTVTGSQTLQPGTNYFWLAYDVKSTATTDNVLDGKCDSVTVSGTTYAPTVVSPNGNRTIKEYLIVGTGTGSDNQQPLHYYQYHGWEGIYTSTEMGAAKDISALAFYKMSGSNTTNPILNVTIYMKHTTASSLSSGTYSTSGYTQVYQGNFPNNATSGWMEVPFSNPFSYNGTDNIEVLVVQGYGAYFSGYPYWAYRTVSPNRARYASSFSSQPTTLTAHNRLANIRFEYSNPTAQTFVSSTVTQGNTTNITAGITDQEIISVEVVTQNSANPLSVSSFTFNTNGSSSPSTDITSAKVYYTSGNPSFSAINQFGTATLNPNGTFTITGTQALQAGTNYFWLAYDIPTSASTGHWVDAQCTSLTVSSSVKTPTVTSPIGNRTIVGALSGIYTIGSGGDYTSFSSAVSALNTYGVAGWVRFRVFSGTYNEQVNLSAYSNASATNTVTFESFTGDSTDVILQYASSSNSLNYTLQVDGGSYYIIKNMTIKGLGSTYGIAVRLNGAVSETVIKNNVINPGTSTSYYGSGVYCYGNTVNNIRISHNKISGTGGYGMYIRGTSASSQNIGVVIDSNIIAARTYGGYLMYNSGLKFIGNQVTISGNNSSYGVYGYYNVTESEFSGNKVISSGSSTAYGLYIRNAIGSNSQHNKIYNNFIAITSANLNTGYGIYGYSNTYTDYVYNNVNFVANTGNNKGAVYIQSGNNSNLYNNMFVASGGATAIRVSDANVIANSDYNNLYTTGSVLGYIGSNSHPNLASWKSGISDDVHSISSNPNFTSATNLHVTKVSLNNLGTPIAGINLDIDGDTRHATTPDIGADEFSVDIDAGITAIVSPITSCSGAQNAQVTIKNFGQNSLSSATINWTIDGTTQTAFSWVGTLATSQSQTVTIGTVNLSVGSHNITAWTSNPNGQSDQMPSNDTTSSTVVISSGPIVNAGSDTTICSSSAFTTSATATGYTTLSWSTSGTGTFVNGTTLTATYTPSAADISAGSVYLKLSAASTGCGNVDDSLLLVLQALPAVSFSGLAATYCPNDAPSALTGTPTGGVFSGPGISGNSFDPASAGSGTHSIKYVYSQGGCSDSATQTTVVSPTLTPTVAGLAAGYCISSAADTLVGTPTGGAWSGAITSNIFNPSTVGVGMKTVTYTVVDAATSCSFDTSYVTQVYSNPTASFTGLAATYCDNQPDTLTGSPLGGFFVGTGITANVFDPATAGAGSHTIMYIINNGVGCSDTASQTTVVGPNYQPTITGLATGYCISSAADTLVGAPTGGTWSGAISNNIFDPAVVGVGIKNVTYTVVDAASSCSYDTTYITEVYSNPTATISGLATSYCDNEPADTLTGSPLGGTFMGAGMSGNIFNPATAGVGIHTIQYMINNGVGCSDTASQTVTVNATPNASFSGLANQYCSTNAPVTLVGTPTGGTFSGNGITGNQFDPSTATFGVNWITYSFNSANGCGDTAMQSVIVNQTPIADAGVAEDTIVNGHDTILYGSATGGSGNYAYSWSPVNMIATGNANMQNPYTITLTSSQLYTLQVTDNNSGCASTDQTQVTVIGGIFGVTASANPTTICAGDSTTIQALASGGGGTYSYLWSSTPSGYSSAFAQDVVYPTVTTTYTVIATDGTSFSSASVVITVNPLPIVSISGISSPYCSNADSVNMIGLPSGGIFSGTGVVGSTFYPSLAGSGAQDITYSYTDANGCTNLDTFNVVVNQTPIANAGIDDTINYGTDTMLYGSANGGGNYVWNWSPSSMLLNTNLQNVTTTLLYATQQYTLTVTDSITGCNSQDSMIVYITGGPLSATASASPNNICGGGTSQLSVLPSGGVGSYNYAWSSTPAGFTSTQQNPTVSPTVTTTYTVVVVSGTLNATDNVVVTVNPAPAVSMSGLDTAYCVNALPDTLIGTPTNGVFLGSGMTNNVFNPATAGVGSHTINFSYTDPNTGCIGDTSATTTVYALPIVSAGTDATISTGHDTTLYGSASGGSGNFTYSWSPSTSVISPNSATTLTTTLTATTQFNLEATDIVTGCMNTDDVIITVKGGTLLASTSATPDTICVGDTSQLIALASGGSGTYTYSWSSNPVGFVSSLINPKFAPTITTTFTVIVGDGTNTTSSSVVVTVNPLPAVSFSGLNATYCSNDLGSMLTGVPSGGSFSGQGLVGSTFDPTTVPQGNYNISYNYTDPSTGCSNFDIQSTAVYEAPTANAGIDMTIAAGHDTLLYGNATGGGNYSWGWSPTLMVVNASLQTAQTIPLTATQLYTLNVLDTVTGCADNDDVIVYVGNSQLSATINATQSVICEGDSSSLTVLATGGTGTYTYNWSSLPLGFSSTATAVTVKPTITTLYSVVVNDGINSVTKNITISVNPKPGVALVGLDTTHCANDAPDTLLGFPAGGTFGGAGANGLFDPVLAGVGTHYVTYTYTDANGCSNTDIDTTDVAAIPIADAGIDVTIYTGHDTTLFGNGSGGSGNYFYEWSPASLLINAYAQNATTQTLTMTNIFTLTLTDLTTGCANTDDVQVTVKGGPLSANPTANPDTICYGNTTQLFSLVSGGTGLYTYQWSSVPVGFSSTLQNPMVTPATTSTFTVIADDGTNSVVDTVVVVVETKPIVQITSYNATNCDNGGFDTLIGSPAGGIFFGTGVTGKLFSPSVAGIGNHQIVYSYTTAGGCNNSDTVYTDVIAAPTANAGSDIMIPCGGPGGLIGSNPAYGMLYSWNPTTALTSPTMSNTIATPTVVTNYTLSVTDTVSGCVATDDVLVDIIGGPKAVVSNDTILCKGESVTISASGGTSFMWSNGVGTSAFTVSPNSTTTYVVTVTDGACSDVDSVVVTVNAPYLFLGPDVVLIDTTTFMLDAGYGFLHYLWNTGDTVQSINIMPYVNANLGLNSYGVAVMDAYGCFATDSVNITYVLTIDEIGNDLGINIYPNPTKGQFNLEIEGTFNQNYSLEILDITGQILFHDEITIDNSTYTKKFDLSNYPKGVYLLRIMNNGLMQTYKLIIQ